MSTKSDIDKSVPEKSTFREEKDPEIQGRPEARETYSCKEKELESQQTFEQQAIFDAQQVFDDLSRETVPVHQPTQPSHLRTLTNLLTARMYIPTHYFLLFVLVILFESSVLFIYTTIGLMRTMPLPIASSDHCHCSSSSTFGETDPHPFNAPVVVNFAPNIAVGAPLPSIAALTQPIPDQPTTALGLIPQVNSSVAPGLATTLTTLTTLPFTTTSVTGKATLSGLLPALISNLVDHNSATSQIAESSVSRSAVTDVVLMTTTLPPSSAASAPVVTRTTVVPPSSTASAAANKA